MVVAGVAGGSVFANTFGEELRKIGNHTDFPGSSGDGEVKFGYPQAAGEVEGGNAPDEARSAPQASGDASGGFDGCGAGLLGLADLKNPHVKFVYLQAAGEVEGGSAPDEALSAPQASAGGSSDELPFLLDGESEIGEIGSGGASSGEESQPTLLDIIAEAHASGASLGTGLESAEPHGEELVAGNGLEAEYSGGFAGTFEGLESVEWWQQLAREEAGGDEDVEVSSVEEHEPLEAESEAAAQQAMRAATGGRAHYGDLAGRRVLGSVASAWGSAAKPAVAEGRSSRRSRRERRRAQPQQSSGAGGPSRP